MTLVQTTTTREQRMLIPFPQVEPRTTIPLQNLRIPGPTPVPPAVLAELARLQECGFHADTHREGVIVRC